MDIKLTISGKEGKSASKELKGADGDIFLGKKIGDKITGESIGLAGYEFEIKGGSDKSGFPMRMDVDGQMRRRILTGSGVGVRVDRKGMRIRKTVVGNTVSANTAQVNLKIIKEGSEQLFVSKEEGAEAQKE